MHLKLCPDLSAKEFQRALKEFVARRGCPQIIASDNGKTFVATGKWLSKLKKDQRLANYLGGLENGSLTWHVHHGGEDSLSALLAS